MCMFNVWQFRSKYTAIYPDPPHPQNIGFVTRRERIKTENYGPPPDFMRGFEDAAVVSHVTVTILPSKCVHLLLLPPDASSTSASVCPEITRLPCPTSQPSQLHLCKKPPWGAHLFLPGSTPIPPNHTKLHAATMFFDSIFGPRKIPQHVTADPGFYCPAQLLNVFVTSQREVPIGVKSAHGQDKCFDTHCIASPPHAQSSAPLCQPTVQQDIWVLMRSWGTNTGREVLEFKHEQAKVFAEYQQLEAQGPMYPMSPPQLPMQSLPLCPLSPIVTEHETYPPASESACDMDVESESVSQNGVRVW
ncbi:hypothetical protein B0H17DRAFT_1148341 [Mycena rosella]|uniref:Uncharacterized protein n=1 Tax=Mycena rosella TaxID=1033263 RepID=A0AAD7CD36_MYCRO|nr:hypothetical protein B0H17DRAFT_1148341 [Mycena rosella]